MQVIRIIPHLKGYPEHIACKWPANQLLLRHPTSNPGQVLQKQQSDECVVRYDNEEKASSFCKASLFGAKNLKVAGI
jgi:hypothetical protein